LRGLSLDNLLAMEVVTADGQLRQASATGNPDLFFGLRGSQSNLGIVTAFHFRLHPVGPTVVAGLVLHPLEKGQEVLRFYRHFTSQASEDLGAWAALLKSPDGHPMAAILACHVGPAEAAEKELAPLKAFGPPLMDRLQPMPYTSAQAMIDESFPHCRFNHGKSSLFDALSDEAIDALVEGFRHAASPFSSILIEHLGGAVSRVAPDATAFPHRHANYEAVIMPMWTEATGISRPHPWADELWTRLQPHATGGAYVSYLGDEGEERVRSAYGLNYARLATLKRQYDPHNLFRGNQNIQP